MLQSALITGASDRIGKAFAEALSEKGYHIFLHYNSSIAKAQETQKEIRERGGSCELAQADFSDESQVYTMIRKICKSRQLDLLVNCASRFVESDIYDAGHELLDQLFKSNFKAAYILTKEYARFHERGLIINILDTKVKQNYTDHLDYLLTKKLLKDFTLLSATQLAPGFRVNGIAPGIILPPPGKDETYTENLAQDIPLKHSGNTQDLVKAMNFFLESDFVTGEIIYVDGGENL